VSAPPVRLFYVDDSGVDNTGWVVFGWVEFLLLDWAQVLDHRIRWRKALYAERRIPASFHLHTAEFLGARGASESASLDGLWNAGSRKYVRNKRVAVLEQALANVGTCEQLRLGVAHRHTTSRNRDFARQKAEVYADLVAHLDGMLEQAGEVGLLVLDGDGSDISFRGGHRRLPLASRRLLEDPLYQRSHSTQLIQMADLVAFAGYQSLLRAPEKRFAWDWYTTFLASRDPRAQPLAL